MITTEEKQNNNNDMFKHLGRPFQEKVVQALVSDRVWAAGFVDLFEVEKTLEYVDLKLIAESHINHFKEYKEFPSVELLASILRDKLKADQDDSIREKVITQIKRIVTNKDVGDLDWVKEKAFSFCKKQQIKQALLESASLIEDEGSYDTIVLKMKKAISAGIPVSDGLDYNNDIDARYSETYRRCVATRVEQLDQKNILNGGLGGGELGIVVAASGCHPKGTKIILSTGKLKNVEDVTVLDKLLGPDSKPRNILQLIRGTGVIYKVIPVKGQPWFANEDHILSLRTKSKKKNLPSTLNVTIKQYLELPNYYKNAYKLYKSDEISGFEGVNNNNSHIIPPYILGLLLGDGYLSKNVVEITTSDHEIETEIREFAEKFGITVINHHKKNNKAKGLIFGNHGKHNSVLKQELTRLNLLNTKSGTKFIPNEYKLGSVKDRLEILAGLIDTDGSLNHSNCYDYVSKSEALANDFCFVARSLGLSAVVNKTIKTCGTSFSGEYFRVCLSGDTIKIPTRISRKKASPRKQIKNVLNTGFVLEKQSDNQEFFGFTLDSDNLYLLEDFTVTHNSGKSHVLIHFGAQALLQGKNVLHYTLELNERITGIRYDSHITQISSTDCIEKKQEIKQYFEEYGSNLGKLRIKHLPPKSTNVNTLKTHMEKLKLKDFVPDLILVDYVGIMRSLNKYELLRLELKEAVQDLRDLAEELDIPIWTALQSNKDGANSDIVDMTNLAEGFSQAQPADVILGLSRKQENKKTGFGHLFIAKNRAGIDGILYKMHLDTAKSTLTLYDSDHKPEQDAVEQVGKTMKTSSANYQAKNNFTKTVKNNEDYFRKVS